MAGSDKLGATKFKLGNRTIFQWCLGFALYATLAFAVGLFLSDRFSDGVSTGTLVTFLKEMGWAVKQGIFAYELYTIAVILLSLTYFLPRANPEENSLSKGLAIDIIYSFFARPFFLLFLPFYLSYLKSELAALPFIPNESLSQGLPIWLAPFIAFILTDFLMWFNHMIRHRIGYFWHFHAVHHSQERMNPFTTARLHPIDWMIAQHIIIIPVLLLTNSVSAVLFLTIFYRFWDSMIHTNLDLKLGPLNYVFVSPQMHRIHHSINPDHIGHNFGSTLSVWDRMFGTLHSDTKTHPKTGVSKEEGFPSELDYGWHQLPLVWFAQQIHPVLRSLNIDSRPTISFLLGQKHPPHLSKRSVTTTAKRLNP